MLINQALSEVLQLVASQLCPSQFVFFECFRLLRKTERLVGNGISIAAIILKNCDRSGTETKSSYRSGRKNGKA
jgi:hypothetical protein